MKGFSKEWKELSEAENKVLADRLQKEYLLSELTKKYSKLLADLSLGLGDTGERIKISEQMKEYERDIEEGKLAYEELKQRKNLLKHSGQDQVEV
jgi:hypothetical protein